MTKLYHKYHNQQPNIVAQFNTIESHSVSLNLVKVKTKLSKKMLSSEKELLYEGA